MDERSLVAAILQGDERALRAFWSDHSAKILAFIKKRIQNPQDAEEIMQDTFLASLESLRDFDFRCKLSTFLCSIAQHKTIDYYRKKKIKQLFFSQMPEEVLPILSQFLGPEEEFDINEVRQRIKVVMAKLRPIHRKILVMKYVEGRSVVEIASLLSVTMKSAESTLFRARTAFVTAYQVT